MNRRSTPIATAVRDALSAPDDARAVYRRTMHCELRREQADDAARTVPASLSSAEPYERFFGTEILEHSRDAIDLSYAEPGGLMLLYAHDDARPIGRVRDLAIDEARGRLSGVLHFSESADAREIWPQVRDGWLGELSIGYRVEKWEVDEDREEWTAKRWTVLEASIVTVPADHSVGVNRSTPPNEGRTMSQDPRNAGGGAPSDQTGTSAANVASFAAAREQGIAAGHAEGARAERERVAEIETLFARFGGALTPEVLGVRSAALTDGWSVQSTMARLLELRSTPHAEPGAHDATEPGPQRNARPSARVEAGDDALDRFRAGAGAVLAVRCGHVTEREQVRAARSSELGGLSIHELAREYLRLVGAPTGGSKADVLGRAFTTRGGMHTAGDFAALMENTANKSLMMGFEESGETWQTWAKVGRLSDFKPASRIGVSSFSDLAQILSSGEYTQGHVADIKETIQLTSWGKMMNIDRRALINDDLSALSDVPRGMGLAGARKVGDLAYGILTGNPTMLEDGVALFHTASHSNLAGTGGAIGTATLATALSSMLKQRGPAPAAGETGATLNIRGRYLIVPAALEGVAISTTEAEFDTDATAGKRIPNSVRGRLEPVADARLDATSATEWYVAADPGLAETVEVAGLDGAPEPVIEQDQPWTVAGVSYRVTLDAAAAAIGWRGLYKNPGA